MKLSDYLISQEITPAAFARKIRVGRMSVHRYISGERFPRPHILERIYKATDGQVSPNDFLDISISCEIGTQPPKPPAQLPVDSPALHNCEDDELVDRPLYPWSRLQANEQQVLDDAYHDMMDQPPEGLDLSPAVKTALDTLSDRATYHGDQFTLDGRVTRIVRLIEEANVLRKEQNLPPLRYPGVRI